MKHKRSTHWFSILTLIAASGVSACGSEPTEPTLPIRYEVVVSGERFTVEVATEAQAKAMADRLASGETGVINGQLVAGDGGYNAPWSWHLDPTTVEAVDLAIELCDGRPSMVEGDLGYWIGTVGQFCPWGATVVAVVSASDPG